MRIMKLFHLFKTCFLLLLVVLIKVHLVLALYEDQIGKFDWKQSYLGKLKFCHVDLNVPNVQRIVVSTEKNVVASLHVRNGAIAWRHVLEAGKAGEIFAMSESGEEIITLNGEGLLLRSWDAQEGVLNWEVTLPKLHLEDNVRFLYNVNPSTHEITIVQIYPKSHVVINVYNMKTASMQTSPVIPAPWIQRDSSCDFVNSSHLICVDKAQLTLHLLHVGKSLSFKSVALASLGLQTTEIPKKLNIVPFTHQGSSGGILFAVELDSDGFVLLQVQDTELKLVKVLPRVSWVSASILDGKLVVFAILKIPEGYKVVAIDTNLWKEIEELEGNFDIPKHHGWLEKVTVLPFVRKDKGISYKLLLSTEDHALILLHQQGKVLWTREEALASIISAELIDLPLSDIDAKIEQEFADEEGNLVTAFMKRITTQVVQLQAFLFRTLTGLHTGKEGVGESGSRIELTRDRFGLHKVIVAVTSAGKVFGIDNLSGQVVWSHFIEDMDPFTHADDKVHPIFIQRTTAHYPYLPVCTVLGKHKPTGKGFIFSFNPITGQVLTSEALPYKVMQSSMLGFTDNKYLRGILLLDNSYVVHVYPEACKPTLMQNINVHYILLADANLGILRGLKLYPVHESVIASEIWTVRLPREMQSITHIVGKKPNEHVHSQGRVMGDRSVLYKYLNPNLVVVVSEGTDATQKTYLNLYLIDIVTGTVVYSATHKRSKGPVHVVHSENWVVYSYYNEKLRRMELSSIELYEGKVQSNSTAFSSLNLPLSPIVEHQTFIFPAGIDAMAVTLTERGITNKHLLIALPSGGLLELPKAFLDPRRPIHPTPEQREEGLIPYMPELPIPSEGIINYNQSILRVHDIQTAPSGLESTCLVFAFGIDLFYTRVTPSRTFDVLKDDFDHFLISTVLLALLILSYITKRLAARKALQTAWK